MINLKDYIREIPDWPRTGVNFKDITTILEDPEVFHYTIERMMEPVKYLKINKIAVVDARGFLFGSVIAYKLGVGICLISKNGKLPSKTVEELYQKEYGFDVLTMHEDSIKKGENVLLVDDILATGGTIEASTKMIERLGGTIVGISVVVDLPFCSQRQKINI